MRTANRLFFGSFFSPEKKEPFPRPPVPLTNLDKPSVLFVHFDSYECFFFETLEHVAEAFEAYGAFVEIGVFALDGAFQDGRVYAVEAVVLEAL